jgi:hypothetical protein
MTLRGFIAAIMKAKIIRGSQLSVVQKLFSQSGAIVVVVEETAKGWLKPDGSKGHRNCRIAEYFPQEKIDEIRFRQFFTSRLNNLQDNSWKKLQAVFGEIKQSTDPDCIVDVKTNNPEVFLRSLTNQFLDIFRLPLLESLSDDTLEVVPPTAPIADNNNDDSVPQLKRGGAELHVDEKFKICGYCVNWNAANKNRRTTFMETDVGKCKEHSEDRLFTDGKACNDYSPSTFRIVSQKHSHPL